MSSKCFDPRVLGLLFAAFAAQAQVNRCTGPQGEVRYSDRACEALGLTRDAESSRRLSGVRLEYYDVSGADGGTLSAWLAQRGPKGFHGLTDWEYRYDYRVAPTPAGTISLTTYFHATGTELASAGDGFVLGCASANRFSGGYFDQSAEIWSRSGTLLATTHQIVYFKS